MNPEQQRIAIAEARDWHFVPEHDDGFGKAVPGQWWNEYNEPVELPLLNDLNAMHEAEKVIPKDSRLVYVAAVARITYSDQAAIESFTKYQLITASAAQRAEAFLRTLVKWIEPTK